jgi:hypothetical protein
MLSIYYIKKPSQINVESFHYFLSELCSITSALEVCIRLVKIRALQIIMHYVRISFYCFAAAFY